MNPASILARTVGEIARANPRAILALADLGIGPRYLFWSLEAAARDLGINVDKVVARLSAALLDEPRPHGEPVSAP